LSEALLAPRFPAGGSCGVRELLASLGPYHFSRELALCRAVAWRTWRPPSVLGFERMSMAYGDCGAAQPFLPRVRGRC